MQFLLGCAIWAYRDWIGDLYPVGARSGDLLSLYGQRFTTVEGNTTFYSVPNAETVARWAQDTPDGFEFCLKFPKFITHQGLLAPQAKDAIAFLRHMSGLGTRLGPVFAQLPPSYAPDQLTDLVAFLDAVRQAEVPLAVEVRHADWFKDFHRDRLNQALENLGVGRVLLDTRPIYECPDDPQLHSERKKPKVPLQPIVTADFCLVRYISHPDADSNLPWLEEWVADVAEWLQQGQRVYFFVHCPVEAQSPANARLFQHLLERSGVSVPPLPWDSVEQPPVQLGLF